MARTHRVHKFVIIPICTMYEEGEVVREDRMKPVTHLTVRDINLKEVAKEIERVANERYSKIEEANSRGPSTNRGISGED